MMSRLAAVSQSSHMAKSALQFKHGRPFLGQSTVYILDHTDGLELNKRACYYVRLPDGD